MFRVRYEDDDGSEYTTDEVFDTMKAARIYASFLKERFGYRRAWVEVAS